MNDWLAISPYVYYDPSYLNSGAKGVYAGGTVKVTLPSAWFPSDWGMYVSGDVSHYWLGTVTAFGPPGFDLPDYTQWNVGFAITYKVLTFDVRYYDTDLSPSQCFIARRRSGRRDQRHRHLEMVRRDRDRQAVLRHDAEQQHQIVGTTPRTKRGARRRRPFFICLMRMIFRDHARGFAGYSSTKARTSTPTATAHSGRRRRFIAR